MKKKILIIDDSKDILELTTNLLNSRGYSVTGLSDGRLALSTIETNRPDLIVLDMLLPDKNGSEICHEIKSNEATKHIPVIISTGHTNMGEYDDRELLKPDSILIKPFELDELIKTIDHFLH